MAIIRCTTEYKRANVRTMLIQKYLIQFRDVERERGLRFLITLSYQRITEQIFRNTMTAFISIRAIAPTQLNHDKWITKNLI